MIERLRELAAEGPVPSTAHGPRGVGMTLAARLGISHTSTIKPSYMGIVITATRCLNSQRSNRINLFAKVPDWSISPLKSSREIVELCGYPADDGGKRLYCTVSASGTNSLGLLLKVDHKADLLVESFKGEPIACWRLGVLQERLKATHPESIVVYASATKRNGKEFFHYREAFHMGFPFVSELPALLATGTVTMDHLIKLTGGSTFEKGPLFKLGPTNMQLLFPKPKHYNLLSL